MRGETVTLLRETKSRTGDRTLVVTGKLSGCAWAPTSTGTDSREVGGFTEQVITGRTLYAPPRSGLTSQHRVRFQDQSLWEVVGDIGPWVNPFTRNYAGDQVQLRRVTG